VSERKNENGNGSQSSEGISGETDGRRKAERPKLTWLDCIEDDLKLMG
jgi:hypothetical protein